MFLSGRMLLRSLAWAQASPAKVDAGIDVFVATDGEAGEGDVGCWNTELEAMYVS